MTNQVFIHADCVSLRLSATKKKGEVKNVGVVG